MGKKWCEDRSRSASGPRSQRVNEGGDAGRIGKPRIETQKNWDAQFAIEPLRTGTVRGPGNCSRSASGPRSQRVDEGGDAGRIGKPKIETQKNWDAQFAIEPLRTGTVRGPGNCRHGARAV